VVKSVLFDLDDTLHEKRTSLKECSKEVNFRFLQEQRVDFDGFSRLFIKESNII
jgi:FMN phosphatase YigB (HAD superfamily)